MEERKKFYMAELKQVGESFVTCTNDLLAKISEIPLVNDSEHLKTFIALCEDYRVDVSVKMFDAYGEIQKEGTEKISMIHFELDPSDITGLFVGFLKQANVNSKVSSELPQGFWVDFATIVLNVLDIRLTANKIACIYLLAANGVYDEALFKRLFVSGEVVAHCEKAFSCNIEADPSKYVKAADLEVEVIAGLNRVQELLNLQMDSDKIVDYVKQLISLYNEGIDAPEVFIKYIANSSVKALQIPEYGLINLFNSELERLIETEKLVDIDQPTGTQ